MKWKLLVFFACAGVICTRLDRRIIVPPPADSDALLHRQASIQCTHVPLPDALALLARSAGVRIDVRWPPLEAVGVTRQARVSLNLSDARAATVLEAIVVQFPSCKLAYRQEGERIVFSTKTDLDREVVVRLYDVRKLATAFAAQAAEADPSESIQGLGTVANGPPQLTLVPGGDYASALGMIAGFVKAIAAPNSWRDAGGGPGEIREIDGFFIIMQTPDNQRRIDAYLRDLAVGLKAH